MSFNILEPKDTEAAYSAGLGSAAATVFGYGGNVGTGLFFPAAKSVGFAVDGGEAMRITSAGYLGIGTASPAQLLHLYATSSPGMRIQNAGGKTWDILGFITGGSPTGFEIRDVSQNAARFNIDTNGNLYGTAGTQAMTAGFFYIPSAAGAPSGTPTTISGRLPLYYDTTNNRLYVYNGGWKYTQLA